MHIFLLLAAATFPFLPHKKWRKVLPKNKNFEIISLPQYQSHTISPLKNIYLCDTTRNVIFDIGG